MTREEEVATAEWNHHHHRVSGLDLLGYRSSSISRGDDMVLEQ